MGSSSEEVLKEVFGHVDPVDIIIPENFQYKYVPDPKKDLVFYPDPILRKPCEPVVKISKSVERIIDRLLEAVVEYDGGGLAAPQIGHSLQICVIKSGLPRPHVLINPQILEASSPALKYDACLSLPGIYGKNVRATKIKVRAMNKKGKQVEMIYEGTAAIVVQHEVDHLRGILFIDRADPANLEWYDYGDE